MHAMRIFEHRQVFQKEDRCDGANTVFTRELFGRHTELHQDMADTSSLVFGEMIQDRRYQMRVGFLDILWQAKAVYQFEHCHPMHHRTHHAHDVNCLITKGR